MKVKNRIRYYIFIIGLLVFVFSGNAGLTAQQIVIKSESHLNAADIVAEMIVNIIRPSWNKTIELKSWAKGTDYAMAYIISPEKDKGTVFLKSNDDVYNYLPKVKKVIKMPMNLLSQNWMGTDMSTDDLIKGSKFSEQYDSKLIGEEQIAGRTAYKILLLPKKDVSVLWGQIDLWVDKASYNQVRLKYYDEDLELVHTVNGSDIKTMGGKLMVSQFEMVPAGKKGYKTRLKYTAIDFDQKLDLNFFAKDNMKNVRP